MGLRLAELHRKLQSPALAPLLHRRWSVLYLLAALARPPPPPSTDDASPLSAAGYGADALDSFLSADLPPASILPLPPAAAAAASVSAMSGVAADDYHNGSSSFLNSSRRGPHHPAGEEPWGPGQEEWEQQRREAAAVEWALLRDCLWVFQGIDGQHLVYDAGSGAHVLDPEVGGWCGLIRAEGRGGALRM